MIFALGEIWLSLLLASLLAFFIAWLLWKWRRKSVGKTEWDDLNGELAARRRAQSQLEHEHSVLLANRNAAEANEVRLRATIDDLQARADLLPALEARVEQAESLSAQPRGAEPPAALFNQGPTGANQDPHAEARRAAATAMGSVVPSQPDDSARASAAEEAANERADEMAAQLDASTTAVEELESERQQLTAESEERHRRIRQLEDELLTVNARAAKAKAALDSHIAQQAATQAATLAAVPEPSSQPVSSQEASEAQAQTARTEVKLNAIQKQLDSTQADLSARTEQATNLQSELQRRGGELERRVIEANKLTASLAESQTKIDDVTHELDGVAQELDSAHEQIAELTAEVDAVRQRESEANDQAAAVAEQARVQGSAHTVELMTERSQTSELESRLVETREQLAEAQEQGGAMRDRLLQANQRAEELGRNQMRLKALEARVAHLSASEAELLQLRSRQPELERRASRADALDSDTAQQRREMQEMSIRLEEAEQRALRVVELEGKVRSAELERDQLRSQADQTTAANAAFVTQTSVESDIASEDRTAEIAELAELRQRTTLVPQLEQRVSDLQRELAEAQQAASADPTISTADSAAEAAEKQAKKETKKKAKRAAKAAARATEQELEAVKKSLLKTERSLKDCRQQGKKLQKTDGAQIAELQAALKHLRNDADRNSATIGALRHDLVKARTSKAGHREKRLRSAEEKVAQLEATATKPKSQPASDHVDDLKLIKGIGPRLERTLNDLGITQFEQLAALSKTELEKLQKKLPRFPGRIARDNWVGQAKTLTKKKR